MLGCGMMWRAVPANRDRICAVLLDVTMPGRAGTEVYRLLKRARQGLRRICLAREEYRSRIVNGR
jgi:FixJ family two-component response regulator